MRLDIQWVGPKKRSALVSRAWPALVVEEGALCVVCLTSRLMIYRLIADSYGLDGYPILVDSIGEKSNQIL